MKNILITGATGFIGRNLKEGLSGRYSLYTPSHSELELMDEKAVYDFIGDNKIELVIHAATWNATRTSPKDTTMVLHNNLKMFLNLARCCRLYEKMIYYGSGAEYDRRHWIPRMGEDYFDTYMPVDDYGLSKYIMAKHTITSSNIYNLRLFAIFGKYEDWQIRFISNACCKAMWGLPITIKQSVFFDYMYINDLVNITKWFIDNNPSQKTYNICTGKTYDLMTLAQKVLAVSGNDLKIVVKEKGLGIEYSGDNTRLLSEIGGYSFSGIDESIRELYDWYLKNKDSIDRNLLQENCLRQ